MARWLILVLAFILLPAVSEAYDPTPQTAEDSAHVDLEKILRVGCRRIDTAASSAGTSGDWSTENCDSTGRKYVNTELPEAITPAATGMNIPTSAPWVLAAIGCYNGATLDLCVGSSNIAHDAAASAANPFLIGGYANAAAPSDVSADLDSVRAWFLRNGAQAMQQTFAGVLATTGAGATGTGVQRVIEANDSQLSAGVGATGDAVATAGGTGSLTAKLRLLTNLTIDPCTSNAKTSVPINIATATTTQLVAASANNFLYVCSINIGPTGGAQNIALIEDDTSACASPTAGMAGGTTAASGWNIAANGGLVLGTGHAQVAKTAATNRYVCLISSAAVQTSGVMTYVLAP